MLPGLGQRTAYFPVEQIKAEVSRRRLPIKDSSLKVYLHEAAKQGLIHDAGRGWYSRLSERVVLDPKPVSRLIREIGKAFPLLDFTVWSTVQLNPWMHHLLAQPVTFLHVPTDALESVGDRLRSAGWEIAVNPPPSAGPQTVHPGEKMVVLRPTLTKQPPVEGRQAPIEKILVDLLVEAPRLALMDTSEAESVLRTILERNLVQVATLKTYADLRKLRSQAVDAINYLRSEEESGVS